MNEISLTEYRSQIESTIEQGRYEEAVAHGQRILEVYPKYMGAYWLLGEAMLGAGQNDHAADMFRRVLSADPEHMRAWVAMSEVAQRRGNLEAAVWYMERAFELGTDDEMVATELRHLHGELEGSEPQRLRLTEGALARLYLRGDLPTRAVSELRKLLEEHPDRLDLKVALAEAHWRSGQRLQATEVCQEILEEQPYALKANLILGEIWTSSGRPEGEHYLKQAQAVDPENQMAQGLFGADSPLPPASPTITPLDYAVAAEDEHPAWMADLEGLAAPEGTALAETGEAMEARIEPPAWLRAIAGDFAARAASSVGASELEEEAAAPYDGAFEELDGLFAAEPAMADEMPEEEILEWLSELEGEETPPEPVDDLEERREEMPAWLAELDIEQAPGEPVSEAEEAPLQEGPAPVEIPDWLRDLAPVEAEPQEAPPIEAPTDLWEEEIPLSEAPPAEELEEAMERPTWLDRDEVPAEDEALAWLEQFAQGREEAEEEALTPTEAESEARVAEILERTAPSLEEAPRAEEALPEVPEESLEAPEAEGPELEGQAPLDIGEEEVLGRAAPAEPAIATDEAEALEEPVPAPEPVREETEEGAPEAPGKAPLAEAIEEAPAEDLTGSTAARLAYAEAHPQDHEAWLDLGRVLWQADRRLEAIETYSHLISNSELLDEVIPDLEDYVDQRPDPDVQQALGDAYMRADRLSDALEIYRRAIAGL